MFNKSGLVALGYEGETLSKGETLEFDNEKWNTLKKYILWAVCIATRTVY